MIYHRDTGFPSNFRRPVGSYSTIWSRLAKRRAREKQFNLPDKIAMHEYQLVEVELDNGRIAKMLLRRPYNETHDLSIAVDIRKGKMFIRTGWLNNKDDQHKTLDTSVYGRP